MVTTLQFSHMFVARSLLIREEKASKKMSLVNRIVYILAGANKGGVWYQGISHLHSSPVRTLPASIKQHHHTTCSKKMAENGLKHNAILK